MFERRSHILIFACLTFLFFAGSGIPGSGVVLAEDEDAPEYEMEIGAWKLAGILAAGIHVTEFRDWQSGGSDTVAVNGRFDLWALRSAQKNIWRNRLRLEYGVTRTDTEDYRPSADVLQLDTRFEHKLNSRIFAYVRGYISTNMGNRYDYFDDPVDVIFFDKQVERQVEKTRISDGFDPLKLEQGTGFGWMIHTTEDDTTSVIFMLGAGTRQLLSDTYFVEDDDPITPELEYQKVDDYSDVGGETVLDVMWTISDVAKFASHGAAFYGFSEERWSARWENSLDLTVTDYIGVTLSAEMLYDEAVFNGDQWKLGSLLTLSYRIF